MPIHPPVCKNILDHIDIPIVFWDERMSTQAVTRTLLEADMSRPSERKWWIKWQQAISFKEYWTPHTLSLLLKDEFELSIGQVLKLLLGKLRVAHNGDLPARSFVHGDHLDHVPICLNSKKTSAIGRRRWCLGWLLLRGGLFCLVESKKTSQLIQSLDPLKTLE